MFTLGVDVGSSSVKATLYDASSGVVVASATSPSTEMDILSPQPGWAEQHPESWWRHMVLASGHIRLRHPDEWRQVQAIGLAYQMHGLVALDRRGIPVRPAVIWCDGRAVPYGRKAFQELDQRAFMAKHLNSPGNFTAAKMGWMKAEEPQSWETVHKVMLPGDYIAYRLTGTMSTTESGLSEMVLWDFVSHSPSRDALGAFGIEAAVLPEVFPNLGFQGQVQASAAQELGLGDGVFLTYRIGDQPNNAFGLGVMDPGEVALNAGTSGVVYAVSDQAVVDPIESFNVFLHTNGSKSRPRNGLLLCLNGCGIAFAQMRRMNGMPTYQAMDAAASLTPPGAEGLRVLPFGNGAERMLGNRSPGASVTGWDFNRHGAGHWYRATLEGVAVSLAYGIDRMRSLGVPVSTVRAGRANLFQSEVFRKALVSIVGVRLLLVESDGASAAARGAAWGLEPASLSRPPVVSERLEPDPDLNEAYASLRHAAYQNIEHILTSPS